MMFALVTCKVYTFLIKKLEKVNATFKDQKLFINMLIIILLNTILNKIYTWRTLGCFIIYSY